MSRDERYLWASIIMAAIAMLLALVLGSGCTTAPSDMAGHETPRGVHIVGDLDMSDARVDAALAEAEKCWRYSMDATRITVMVIEGVWPTAGWTRIDAPPDIKYQTLRHEMSHIVGAWATGGIVPNGYGRCWL